MSAFLKLLPQVPLMSDGLAVPSNELVLTITQERAFRNGLEGDVNELIKFELMTTENMQHERYHGNERKEHQARVVGSSSS